MWIPKVIHRKRGGRYDSERNRAGLIWVGGLRVLRLRRGFHRWVAEGDPLYHRVMGMEKKIAAFAAMTVWDRISE
jgi:hypothetical protein